MAEGSSSYMDMAAPLYPKDGVEIKQQGASSAVDILTLTAAASGTGDFLVAQNSSGTELFVIDSAGALGTLPSITIPGAAGVAGVVLQKTGTGQTTFARLRLPGLETAPASAGLTKGGILVGEATPPGCTGAA